MDESMRGTVESLAMNLIWLGCVMGMSAFGVWNQFRLAFDPIVELVRWEGRLSHNMYVYTSVLGFYIRQFNKSHPGITLLVQLALVDSLKRIQTVLKWLGRRRARSRF